MPDSPKLPPMPNLEHIDVPENFFKLIATVRNAGLTGVVSFVHENAMTRKSEWVEFHIDELAASMCRTADTARRAIAFCSHLRVIEVQQEKDSKRMKARLLYSNFARVIDEKRAVNEEKKRLRGLKKGKSPRA